jgi:hypothetical protein
MFMTGAPEAVTAAALAVVPVPPLVPVAEPEPVAEPDPDPVLDPVRAAAAALAMPVPTPEPQPAREMLAVQMVTKAMAIERREFTMKVLCLVAVTCG